MTDAERALAVEQAADGVEAFLAQIEEDRPRLEALAAELLAATERMNAAIESVEAALAARWPRRSAAIEIDGDRTLLFCRWDGRSRLLLVDGQCKTTQPLQNASRAVRSVACARLAELVDQIQYDDEGVAT